MPRSTPQKTFPFTWFKMCCWFTAIVAIVLWHWKPNHMGWALASSHCPPSCALQEMVEQMDLQLGAHHESDGAPQGQSQSGLSGPRGLLRTRTYYLLRGAMCSWRLRSKGQTAGLWICCLHAGLETTHLIHAHLAGSYREWACLMVKGSQHQETREPCAVQVQYSRDEGWDSYLWKKSISSSILGLFSLIDLRIPHQRHPVSDPTTKHHELCRQSICIHNTTNQHAVNWIIDMGFHL